MLYYVLEFCRRFVSTRSISCRIRANPGLISTEGWKRVKAQQYFSTEEPGQLQPFRLYIAEPFLHCLSVEVIPVHLHLVNNLCCCSLCVGCIHLASTFGLDQRLGLLFGR